MMKFENLIFDKDGYANVESNPIDNTVLIARKDSNTNNINVFRLTPIDGYVLHDKNYDEQVFNEDTFEETDEIILGFRRATAGFSGDYDFDTNPREFYTLHENELPKNAIIYGKKLDRN